MCQLIQLRRWSQAVLVALGAVLLVVGTAQAKKPKNTPPETWNLANEFPKSRKNPAADKYGNRKVWLFASETANGAEYKRMKYFDGPAKLEAECGLKNSYLFTTSGTPAILYNGGPTLEEGQNRCAPSATYRLCRCRLAVANHRFRHGIWLGRTSRFRHFSAGFRDRIAPRLWLDRARRADRIPRRPRNTIWAAGGLCNSRAFPLPEGRSRRLAEQRCLGLNGNRADNHISLVISALARP
jgi:hypothetical protein